jgi:hypothetical protein
MLAVSQELPVPEAVVNVVAVANGGKLAPFEIPTVVDGVAATVLGGIDACALFAVAFSSTVFDAFGC